MPTEREKIIEQLKIEAINRCRKRIEDAASARKRGFVRKTYPVYEQSMTAALKKMHGL